MARSPSSTVSSLPTPLAALRNSVSGLLPRPEEKNTDAPSRDHTGPVHEGDTLYSELHVDGAVPLPDGRGGVLKLRSLVYAVDDPDRKVLDWRFTALQS